MSSNDIEKTCATADMIVCGYAFTRMPDNNIQILQLHKPNHALILSREEQVLETTMDDVEIDIVKGYWNKNKKYMEVTYA